MRVQYIELVGKKYPMVLSLSAIERIEEEFGSMESMDQALTYNESTGLTGIVHAAETVLGVLLDAGRTYASIIGEDVPPLPSCRLADVLDMDIAVMIGMIFGVISSSSEREVEAVSKNAGATGEDTAATRGSSLPEPRPD